MLQAYGLPSNVSSGARGSLVFRQGALGVKGRRCVGHGLVESIGGDNRPCGYFRMQQPDVRECYVFMGHAVESSIVEPVIVPTNFVEREFDIG